jgi:hypothetical protein
LDRYFGSWYAGFIEKTKMKANDQSSLPIDPQPDDNPEEQGLRILARFIARKLARSRRDERAGVYERGEDSSSASVSVHENIS